MNETASAESAEKNPAETYERYMVPALFKPCAERLLASADAGGAQSILDVGCGTGVVARLVRPVVGDAASVTGVDPSEGMLAVARRYAEEEGLRIDWREGAAERLPFADRSFDLALCQFALMFFEDRAAGLSEIRRVLRPGGRLVLDVFQGLDHHPFYAALDAAITGHLGTSPVADIFSLGDADRLERMLGEAGFDETRIEQATVTARFPEPESFLAGEIDVDTAAIPVMHQMTARDRKEITEALQQELKGTLRRFTHDDHVVLDFHLLVATGTRPLQA